jgi:putative effector of murein hydrolase
MRVIQDLIAIIPFNASLAVTMVVVTTGLVGANFGASILDAVGIRDGVARGLGIGAAAHGLGTAAFANEEDAFPFAVISMALTSLACTVLVSLPMVRRSILRLALLGHDGTIIVDLCSWENTNLNR